MMRTALSIAAAAAALAACSKPAPPTPPQPVQPPPAPEPTPAQPAQPAQPDAAAIPLRLPRAFVPTAYAAKIAIDPDKAAFDGSIRIDGNVAAAAPSIWLHGYHLQIRHASATRDGRTVALAPVPHGEEMIEFRADAPLDAGAWQVAIDYTAQIDPFATLGAFKEVAAGKAYVYSQFESIGARRAFPCLDEPDNKVPWQLTIDVPKGDIAVANTYAAHDEALPDGGHHYEFAPTQPLPSYLVAFGVGPFDVVPAGKTKSGVPVRIVVPQGRAAEASYAAASTARILDLLEEWFGIPYAFGKADMLVIPTTSGFGAMENAGLVTFEEGIVLIDPKRPSWERREEYVAVAAHELAHQWFGDLVTTAWWNDIWLNEGFANWMETKITARFEPAWHHELDEVHMRRSAQQADSLVSARQIRQPIETENDILNAFDGITYDKGASVLRMFETYVGPDTFQRGVREYLTAHRFGNGSSDDFVAAIGKVANKDLGPAFATFLDQAGLPQLSFELSCTGDGPRVAIAQRRYVAAGSPQGGATKPWIVPVCVAFDGGKGRREACTLLDAAQGTLALDTKQCPRWIAPNVGGRGYYRSDLTAKQVTALRDEAWPLLTPAERLVTFEEATSSATIPHAGNSLPLQLAISFVPKLLAGGERYALHDVEGLVEHLVHDTAAEHLGKLEAWLRLTFSPGATKLGPLPKDADDINAEATRSGFWATAAYTGRDPELAKQAIALAAKWRELPDAMQGVLLDTAVDASADVQAAVRGDVDAVHDNEKLKHALHALATVRDPARLEHALDVMLDPKVDFRHSMWMLAEGAPVTAATRQAFFRAHQQELMKRLPPIDDTGVSTYAFAAPFAEDCNAERRDQIVDYMKATFSAIPGAPRILTQLSEGLDRCIETRKVLQPEIAAWLGGIKIAGKPKSK